MPSTEELESHSTAAPAAVQCGTLARLWWAVPLSRPVAWRAGVSGGGGSRQSSRRSATIQSGTAPAREAGLYAHCPALTVDLAHDLAVDNLTPAHELFHLFQYGYTLFKNGWFLEGMARWSESALRADVPPTGALPRCRAEVEKLFAARYGAGAFWNTLAAATDPDGRLAIPADLGAARYIGSPSPVIGDDQLRGVVLMRQVLEALDRADDAVSRGRRLDPLDWSEAQQRAPENNARIWAAVVEVLRSYATAAPELSAVLRALDTPD